MAETITAEQLAQRALDVNVLDDGQLQSLWSELGSTTAPLADFQQAALRRGFLTQYQLERLMAAQRSGFWYGSYKVLYCVGAGTFARVYRAAHRETGKMYAVKVLRSRYSNPKATDPKSGKSNRAIIELFRREGELGLQLQHPNIVGVHELYSQGMVHYLVMEFIEGRNLREFYRARRRFDPVEAAHIMEGVMSGLHYALQQGITHRDLKMSNILLSSDGEPKLVDFGLAGLQGEEAEEVAEGVSRRTVDYAGLERATGVRKDDPRTDIFFAGCIFYQMLTGEPALAETKDRAQAGRARYSTDIKPVLVRAPKLPLPLAMVVNKSLEFDPDKRYQTPSDMLVDLKLAIKRVKAAAEGKRAGGDEMESQEGIDASGQPRKLLIVESDVKMQDMLRELFKKNGYRVLVAADPERAMARFFNDPQAADLMLLTTGNNGRAALEAFNRLGQEAVTRDLPAVLLLDESHHEWSEEAAGAEHRVVAKMPIKMRELRELLVDVSAKKVS